MKKLFVSLMLFAAILATAGSAGAVVVSGSTYSIYLAGEASGNPFLTSTVFDDVPAFVERGGLLLTLSEGESTLDNGDSHITLNINATGDLFPVLNEGAFMGIGTLNDPLDLAIVASLYDARVTLRDLFGNIVFESPNIAGIAENNFPWDGSFPSIEHTFRISEVGGQDIASISFDFFVHEDVPSDVPEPGSVLLCGIGLMAGFGARRYRRSKA
jgi:hypothetical protein